MHFLKTILTLFGLAAFAGASCGPETDPYNTLLTVPASRALEDSLAALLDRNTYVSIAHVDSHFCVDNWPARYPDLACRVVVEVDTVIKGKETQKRYTFSLTSAITSFFTHISQRQFLLYSENSRPGRITIAPGCYSNYTGYYIHENKFFNKYISDSSYLPVESLGWTLNRDVPQVYRIWPTGIVCITSPCRIHGVNSLGGDSRTVSALLDSNGEILAGLHTAYYAWLEVTGHFAPARLDGWAFEDTVFVVERILGLTISDSTYLSIDPPPPRASGGNPNVRGSAPVFDILGKRQLPGRSDNDPPPKSLYLRKN